MKLKDLLETATTGVTSVASIGKVEFQAYPHQVKLYKRCSEGHPQCIATIRRKKNDGWRFKPTTNWDNMNLPHFGQLNNIQTSVSGMKTISNNLDSMLKKWGIRYDELMPKKEDK